jgi:Putative MetA-pathway of phenol degradation
MTEIGGRSWRWWAAAVLLWTTAAQAQTVGFSTAVYGARSSGPAARLDSLFVFPAIDITAGPMRAALTVPLVRTTSETSDGGVSTSSGAGDPLMRLDVRVWEHASRGPRVTVAAAVKPALVDPDTGRGTGQSDAAIGATLVHPMTSGSLMADVMYWRYGDPAGVDFPDAWAYSLGATHTIGLNWSLLGAVSGFTAALPGEARPMSFTLGLLRMLQRRQSVAVTASLGANDSAGDFSIGASWRIVR